MLEVGLGRQQQVLGGEVLATLLEVSVPVIVGLILDLELGLDVLPVGLGDYLGVVEGGVVAQQSLLLEHLRFVAHDMNKNNKSRLKIMEKSSRRGRKLEIYWGRLVF